MLVVFCRKLSVYFTQLMRYRLFRFLIEHHKNIYIINYPFGTTWYKVVIPRHRQKILLFDSIVDEQGNDIKNNIIAFMGPYKNFHGCNISPGLLGYKSITFTFMDKEPITFLENQLLLF